MSEPSPTLEELAEKLVGHACYAFWCDGVNSETCGYCDVLAALRTVDARARAEQREADARVELRTSGLKGCGDHSCLVEQPKGMATNGGCRCRSTKVRRAFAAAIRAQHVCE